MRLCRPVRPCFDGAMAEYHRRLPHFHPDNAYLFLTWRLWGTLPALVGQAVSPAEPHSSAGHAFVVRDRALDGHCPGPKWLQDPRIANVVARAIVIGDVERHFYELCAWVVMPNHVHLLILPQVCVPVLMRWLKDQRRGRRIESSVEAVNHSGKTSLGTTTCETRINSTGPSRTLKEIRPPRVWWARRRDGPGPARDGRRNRLPHQTPSNSAREVPVRLR